MSIFRFKKFEVRNEKSAMKVNTDGVLLGAACPVRPDMKNVLDIGTGTGTIALMLAQRISALTQTTDSSIDLNIIGIDIDEDAAAEAGANFAASAWAGSLEARRQALAELSVDRAFDLIVSNPPYYDSSLTNPDAKKTAARHTDETGLSFREVLEFAGKHLAQEGIVSMVLPADQEASVLRHGRMNGLKLAEILRIKTVERKPSSRIIITFIHDNQTVTPTEKQLTIMNKGKYTDEYISLVKDFYLFA